MSGAPIGQALTVTMDGEERTYHIKPNVFSDATIQALNRMYKDMAKRHRAESIKELSSMRGQIDATTYAELQTELVKNFVGKPFTGYMEAVELLQTREGMAIALLKNCDEIKSSDEAFAVIGAVDSVVDLFEVLFDSGNEAIEAAKNSDLLSQAEKEEESE